MSKLKDKVSAGEVYFIAEMSANHGNNLETALSIVDAAADAGADCLKVQTYTADTMTLDCKSELFKVSGGLWDERYLYDLYSEASFPWEWHDPVKKRCEERGLDFLSTPFDKTAVDYLDDLGCDVLKIASFELVDIPLIEYAASKNKTLIISTGMGSLEEIGDAVEAAQKAGAPEIILLRCCSEYPANPCDMNLASIIDMRERFNVPIGFSDHSTGHAADVVAACLGACVIEKHMCLSRKHNTVDSAFSMEPREFAEMVEAVNLASDDIAEGEVFTDENIRVIRPSYGVSPKYYKRIIGTPSKKAYHRGDPIEYRES